ncbi:MAG: biotin/lipoyl-containing protein [Bryobacteraceae bacterium]|jgi:biotin carboxyl carrier protein
MKETAGAEIVAVEPGVYSVLLDGRSYEARVEDSNGSVIVFIDGHRFAVEIRDPRRRSRATGRPGAEGRLDVVAPMPGKVVRLLVAQGDTVEAGQGLLVVEAMKMQNELKAPKGGRVTILAARQGATVAAGEVLAVIE